MQISSANSNTIVLKAEIAPTNASDKYITWDSNNPNVVLVSPLEYFTYSALATAVSSGTATISAKTRNGNFTDSCAITVYMISSGDNVTGIVLSDYFLDLDIYQIGQSPITFSYTVVPSSALNKEITITNTEPQYAEGINQGNGTILVNVYPENMLLDSGYNFYASIILTTVDGGFTGTCNLNFFFGPQVD